MASENQTGYRAEAWDILQHLFKVKKINDHILHFAATFSGKIDVERLKAAVNLSAGVFPLVKCRFDESGKRPFWVDCGFTAEDMVTCAGTDNAEESTDAFFRSEVNTFAGPQARLRVIRGENSDTLAVLMNHMLCDAAGFKDYLYLLGGIYTNLETDSGYCPEKSGSRRIGQITQPFSVRDKFKIITSKNNMSVHDPAAFALAGNPQNPFIERRTVPRELFLRLKAHVKKRGATVNDLFLTAYMRRLYREFGHTVTLPCTVDLRKYLAGRKARGICNLCTNLFCNIGQEAGGTFDQTLEKVTRAMDREKSSISCLKSITLMEKIFDCLPYRAAKKMVDKNFSNPPIAFTNIGVLDRSRLVFGKVETTGAYMTGSIKYAPYFQLAVSTYDNQPTLSVNLYGTAADRALISRFLDGIVDELKQAV